MIKPDLPGYIILGRYGDLYIGPIECSFSLDTSYERTQFFWSSKVATSNFGGKFEINGLEWAKESIKRLEKDHPDINFQIYDVHDDNLLPVELDWDEWREACKPAETLSGVKDKFKARNVKFTIK
jgi:hypothetical protein